MFVLGIQIPNANGMSAKKPKRFIPSILYRLGINPNARVMNAKNILLSLFRLYYGHNP